MMLTVQNSTDASVRQTIFSIVTRIDLLNFIMDHGGASSSGSGSRQDSATTMAAASTGVSV
jgi:hypothetical protein